MEPDRYWLLYFGVMFVFLGSRAGQAICWNAFTFLRICIYLTVSVLAWTISRLMFALSAILLRLADYLRAQQKDRTAAKPDG